MLTRTLDRTAPTAPASPPRPVPTPDAGYDALPRFARLAADLAAAVPRSSRPRWKEGRLFFFDRRRQAELEAARAPAPQPPDPFEDLSARIAAELPGLCASPLVRRAARGVDGLRAAVEKLAPLCPAAKDLADLLAVPDEEVVTVIAPASRLGVRVLVRGVADVGQFHLLLAAAAGEVLGCPPVARRFVSACRDVNPTAAAGVPMVAEARFQMYATAALRPDGSLPDGFGGCDHWLWPTAPLAAVPRTAGERVVLVGPPAFRQTWEVSRRFPALAADVGVLEALSPFRVAERLSKLTGRPVSPVAPAGAKPALAKAA